ncbi:MAG: MotA/TolQ/ExbB proton channel family protein [Planctomycetota bacterium]|nr:MAG: MotA/TolQ/ExbB proton channel family protein [Planctomycetota bacterium]
MNTPAIVSRVAFVLTVAAPAASLVAQQQPPSPSPATAPSLWELVVQGGLMMIPIALCSLIALAVAVERWVALRPKAVVPPGALKGLDRAVASAEDPVKAALAYCRKHPSPLAQVLQAGMERAGEPLERIERAIAEAGERAAFELSRRLRTLSVIGSVAPLLGLLGTIFGLISAFQTIAVSSNALGKPEMFAGGIYEALTTTAAGLLVAIPAVILHNYFLARIEHLLVKLDDAASTFLRTHAAALSPPAHDSVHSVAPRLEPQHVA